MPDNMLLTGDFGKIAITVLGRTASSDYWEGNWLPAKIEINVGLFSANYICNLRTDDFSDFHHQLDALLADIVSEIRFSTMEEGLLLNFKKDALGHFVVDGQAKSDDNYPASLLFQELRTIIPWNN